MNQLYVLRHGIAVPHGDPDITDDERPLTPKGEKRVKQVARGLRRFKVEVDRIVTSPLPRARRTAEIVADVLELTDYLESAEELRGDASAKSIQQWLKTRTEDRLMIVGHNPSLSDLIGLLIAAGPKAAPFELDKAGIAALSGTPEAPMRLDWLAPARMLRKLDD